MNPLRNGLCGYGFHLVASKGDLRPELVGCMLVVVVRPGLRNPVIPHMQHHRLEALQTAYLPFALSDVKSHGMLVVGHSIMEE
jgi:hypothetical protein